MPSETPGPTRKEMGMTKEAAFPIDVAGFRASPDFIVLNPGHTDAVRKGLPSFVAAENAVTPLHDKGKDFIAVGVDALGTYLREHASDEVTNDKGDQVHVFPYVAGMLDMELRQFYGPEVRIRRLHQAVETDNNEIATIVREDLQTAFSQVPGQLLAIDNLLHNTDFEQGAKEYSAAHFPTPDDGTPVNDPLQKRIAGIEDLLSTHKQLLSGPIANDAEKEFLERQGVKLFNPDILEQIK